MAKKRKIEPTPSNNPSPAAKPVKKSKVTFSIATGFWKNYWLPAALLMLAGTALYLPTLSYEFVLDDKIVYSENNFVKKGFAGIKDIFTTESFVGYFGEQKDLLVGARYRPLSLATFAIEHQFFGLNSRVGHLINALLSGLLGVVLFRILAGMFPMARYKHWWMSVPFVGALLFTLHPLHSEVVANIKGRDEILCMLFSMLALWSAMRYAASGKIAWLGAIFAMMFLGLLSKESALTFAAVIPLSLYWFARSDARQLVMATAPALLAAVIFLVIRTQTLGFFISSGKEITTLMNNPFYGMQPGEKFATIFYTLGLYLKLLVFPHPLTHDYYPYHIPIMHWNDVRTILSLLANLALGGLAIWGLPKRKIWSYGILFYFITLSIVSNLPFTVGTFMNERFLYMPSFGFALVVAWLLAEVLPKRFDQPFGSIHWASLGLFVLLSVGYTTRTLVRLPAWRSEYSLNAAAIKVSVNSARANTFMGTAIFKQYQEEQDQARKIQLLDECERYIDRSIAIHPAYKDGWIMKTGIAGERYRYTNKLEPLLETFYNALLVRPDFPYIYQYLDYLKGRGSGSNVIADFCYKAGVLYADQKKDYVTARKFLQEYGLSFAPGDSRIQAALSKLPQ